MHNLLEVLNLLLRGHNWVVFCFFFSPIGHYRIPCYLEFKLYASHSSKSKNVSIREKELSEPMVMLEKSDRFNDPQLAVNEKADSLHVIHIG